MMGIHQACEAIDRMATDEEANGLTIFGVLAKDLPKDAILKALAYQVRATNQVREDHIKDLRLMRSLRG